MQTTNIIATVNVPESIRRGSPAATTTVSIPLAELCALLTEEERKEAALRLKERNVGTLGAPIMEHRLTGVGTIPTADAAGLAEALRASIAHAAAEARAEAAAGAIRATERTERRAARHAALRAHPILGVRVPNHRTTEQDTTASLIAALPLDYWTAEMGVSVSDSDHNDDLAAARDEELMTAIRALVTEVNTTVAAQRTQRAAARVERLLPHLDREEQEMHRRGYLDLTKVEARLSRHACEALRSLIEPPACAAEIVSDSHAAATGPVSRATFRRLRTIERRLGRTCELDCYGAVLTTTQTADGRTVNVCLTMAD